MLQDVVAACWAIFIGAWVLGALYNARYAPKDIGGAAKLGATWWQSWIVMGVAVLVLRILVPRSFWTAITFRSDILAAIGLVVLVGSTLFTLWARWTLGKMWSYLPTLREHHELRTDGPYRFTRHPIYTGILGMWLGSTLVAGFGGGIIALVVFVGVFLVRIPREEQLMLQTFGDQYVRYQRKVPRLVPFLHI